ncbi:MAG: PhzF family phenazine biosynthesis protein [Rhabdochlamydiaceae bacterium]|nr:PhzF family phenazine biosynthesis protein [Candidatus Amphrikana amoebophyrae]
MKFWQVDAFTNEMYSGNPAAVFICDEFPSKQKMLSIANEMNLSETAFVVLGPTLHLRWFTPSTEVKMCGHATIATAHILWQEQLVDSELLKFHTLNGEITVARGSEGYQLNMPQNICQDKESQLGDIVEDILGYSPLYIGSNSEECMVVVETPDLVRSFIPPQDKICQLAETGFLITAQNSIPASDFVYRAFFPKEGISEDPATGSACACLAPYWAKVLGKNELKAQQVSQRGGEYVSKSRL